MEVRHSVQDNLFRTSAPAYRVSLAGFTLQRGAVLQSMPMHWAMPVHRDHRGEQRPDPASCRRVAMPGARGARRPPNPATLFPDARNRLIEGDCLAVMRALPAQSIDLIYVDPPFYSGHEYTLPEARDAAPSAAAAAEASEAHAAAARTAAAFVDRWEGGLG